MRRPGRLVLHINPQGACGLGRSVGWVECLRDPTLNKRAGLVGSRRLDPTYTRPNLQHRRTGQAEKAEHGHKRLEPVAAVSLKVKPLVVEKALAREEPGPALMHVALNDCRRGIALVAQRLREVPARIIENVTAAPIDEFQHAKHRKAESEAVFNRFV